MVWLVDYTHYTKDIDPELARLRSEYFEIKTYKRAMIIGETAPVKTRVFSTGLLRIATILARNGIDVKYIHYYMLEDLLDSTEEYPEIVAFSAVCPTVPHCARMAELIKAKSPKTKVKLGGSHVNVCTEETLRRYPVFDELTKGYECEGASKVVERKLNGVSEIYVDYSLLPYPITEYAINTFSSMGCPFACSYCVDGLAPHFVAQPDGNLGVLKELLPRRNLVHFFDSVLGFSADGIRRVTEAVKRTEHDFILSCDMRADLLTPELVHLMEGAGFREIRMGIESSDDELLSMNKRTLSVKRFEEQVKMVRANSNLYITLYSITGLPGTTRESQMRTLEYFDYLLMDKLADEIKNALYVPYPIDGLDYLKRGVYVTNDDWACYDRQSYPVFRTDLMSEAEIWSVYLDTARSINNSWLRSCGFDTPRDIPKTDIQYAEYIQANYLRK